MLCERKGRLDLMRCGPERPALRPHLRRHQPFRSWSISNQDELAWAQFGHAEAPQRFHVHENVGRPLPSRKEAESAKPVEPFDLCSFETACWRDRNMGARRRHLGGMNRRGFVHCDDPERLKAFRPGKRFADHSRPLISRLVTITTQAS